MGNRIWSKTQGIVNGAELRSIRQIPLRTHANETTLFTAPGVGRTPYNGLSGEASPERGIL